MNDNGVLPQRSIDGCQAKRAKMMRIFGYTKGTQKAVFFLATALLMTSCLSTGVRRLSPSQSKENEIETNIRVPVVIKNIPPKKHSLLERMKYFEIPGASVAVINMAKSPGPKAMGSVRMERKKE